MGMTTLLSITAMFAATRQLQPKQAYASCLDIWMVATMFFVFMSLMEFIIVHQFSLRGDKKRAQMIENYSRIAYPVTFLFFNIIYWPSILHEYLKEECQSHF